MGELSVELLGPGAAGDVALVEALAALVNGVYADSETGLWLDGASRTSAAEVAGFIRAGEIAVARDDGRTIGCVHVQRWDDATGEFGLLAADPEHRGSGVGRALVRFAEDRSRDEGRTTMRLELLVPRAWTHPAKAFLAQWYERIGYRVVRRGSIDEDYPHLAPLLATPCDFLVWHKPL
ncbi:GNAT family N-acetyltransferase [Jiangella alba]|uniref:Acetyltransferase (GNAT) domain-containing protein n=1 Tax=Jiangella alba TaxID=561176 RepID=A0A1H5PML0_9ACTN|nr:GNAT family N-acetyltransferase [Jiangella alba]SEF15142.1 Acetyltransferase (GNAT) domain-containing protein [Jiangella alba]